MDEVDSGWTWRVVEEVAGGAVAGGSDSAVGEESSGRLEGACVVAPAAVGAGESVGEEGAWASVAGVVCETKTGSGSAEHAARSSAGTTHAAVFLIDLKVVKPSPLWGLSES